MSLRTFVGKVLYRTIGNILPDSSKGKIYRRTRSTFGKMIVHKCGTNTNFGKHARFSHQVSIGDNSGIGNRAFLQGMVIIGRNVMMAEDVKIFTVNHKTSRIDVPMCEQGVQKERAVIIGDDVWIGSNVIILPGSKIGNGVILGAGSVVRGDIPDYAVVVGNPARVIRYRTGAAEDDSGIDNQ